MIKQISRFLPASQIASAAMQSDSLLLATVSVLAIAAIACLGSVLKILCSLLPLCLKGSPKSYTPIPQLPPKPSLPPTPSIHPQLSARPTPPPPSNRPFVLNQFSQIQKKNVRIGAGSGQTPYS